MLTSLTSWPVRLAALLLVATVLAACGGAAGQPTVAPTVLPTVVPTAAPSPTSAAPSTSKLTAERVRANLATSQYHDRKHADNAVTCQTCHPTSPETVPGKDVCLTCHGPSYTELAQRTKEITPNPHATHFGEEVCTACHGMHSPFVYICTDCHSEKVYKGRFKTTSD